MRQSKKYHKKLTCSQIRILGNGTMTAGFLLLCVAVGTYGGENGWNQCVLIVGGSLLAAGFVGKLLGWRCPECGAHLMLCIRGRIRRCPHCGGDLW